MCGIVGIIGEPPGEAALQAALAALQHRGPDDCGLYRDTGAGVVLGHTRLAILDRAGGHQPMQADDGDTVLVCNGELYGFEALRGQLQARGHRFHTASDSEVLLALYRTYGSGCFSHLRGEFAFLLHDRRRGLVLAARDRFGIKPLFHARTPQGHLFASEAKALFAGGLLQPVLDLPAIRDMQAGAWVDSVFAGIDAVPPASYVCIDLAHGTVQTVRYWDLQLSRGDDAATEQPFSHYRDALRQQLDEAVRLRLRADVPVGIALSGGIDSAVVAALARRHHAGTLHSFSIGFPDRPALDESARARATAAQLGTTHHEVHASTDALLGMLERALWHSELPTQSLNGAGKCLLAQCAAGHVRVLLSGEGSDELFLGYGYFRQPRRRRRRGRWLRQLPYRRVHHAVLAATAPGSRSCVRDEPRPAAGDTLLQALYFAIRGRLLSYILTLIGDRSEMAFALEGRVPFLDHHLFECVRRIPLRWKQHPGCDKYILREAVRDLVSDAVLQEPKQGYRAPPLPMRRGRHARLDALLDAYLSPAAVREAGIYRPAWVRGLLALRRWLPDRLPLARRIDRALFYAITVQVLQRQFVAGQGLRP